LEDYLLYLTPYQSLFFYLVAITEGLGVLVLIFFGLPLTIIDFIAVFFFIKIQHPHGRAKVISYTALIVISLVLALLVILNLNLFMNKAPYEQ
jgi:hypothetical protein